MEEKRFRLGNLFNFLTNKQLKQVLGGYGDDDGDEGPAGCYDIDCGDGDTWKTATCGGIEFCVNPDIATCSACTSYG